MRALWSLRSNPIVDMSVKLRAGISYPALSIVINLLVNSCSLPDGSTFSYKISFFTGTNVMFGILTQIRISNLVLSDGCRDE